MDKHNKDHKKSNKGHKKPVNKNPQYKPENASEEKAKTRKS